MGKIELINVKIFGDAVMVIRSNKDSGTEESVIISVNEIRYDRMLKPTTEGNEIYTHVYQVIGAKVVGDEDNKKIRYLNKEKEHLGYNVIPFEEVNANDKGIETWYLEGCISDITGYGNRRKGKEGYNFMIEGEGIIKGEEEMTGNVKEVIQESVKHLKEELENIEEELEELDKKYWGAEYYRAKLVKQKRNIAGINEAERDMEKYKQYSIEKLDELRDKERGIEGLNKKIEVYRNL